MHLATSHSNWTVLWRYHQFLSLSFYYFSSSNTILLVETIFIIINVFDDLSTVAQQLSNAHLMDATEGLTSSASSSFQQRSNALQTPLPLCTVTPLGAQNSPLSPWDVNQSSSSSSASQTRNTSIVATSDMYHHLPPMSPSTFTAGMCLPGSTAAGHTPGVENHVQMGNGSLPSLQHQHQQNAFIVGTPPSAQMAQSHHLQQANSPLMLTHLSQPPSSSSPSAAASQHEPIDDSMS